MSIRNCFIKSKKNQKKRYRNQMPEINQADADK